MQKNTAKKAESRRKDVFSRRVDTYFDFRRKDEIGAMYAREGVTAKIIGCSKHINMKTSAKGQPFSAWIKKTSKKTDQNSFGLALVWVKKGNEENLVCVEIKSNEAGEYSFGAISFNPSVKLRHFDSRCTSRNRLQYSFQCLDQVWKFECENGTPKLSFPEGVTVDGMDAGNLLCSYFGMDIWPKRPPKKRKTGKKKGKNIAPVVTPNPLAEENKKIRELVECNAETEEELRVNRLRNTIQRTSPNLVFAIVKDIEKHMDRAGWISSEPRGYIKPRQLRKFLITNRKTLANPSELKLSDYELELATANLEDSTQKSVLCGVYTLYKKLCNKVLAREKLTQKDLDTILEDLHLTGRYVTYLKSETEPEQEF